MANPVPTRPQLAPVATSAVLAYIVWKDMLPKIPDVHKATERDVRMGEAMATSLSLLGGLAIGMISKDGLAFWTAAGTSLVLLGFYEYALKRTA